MSVKEVVVVDKIKAKTIKLLKENITESRAAVRQIMELRSFLFYAIHRGMPLSINNITSDFLAGYHEKQTVMSLSQYVLELEQAQRQLESLNHYISYCEKEIENILDGQISGEKEYSS